MTTDQWKVFGNTALQFKGANPNEAAQWRERTTRLLVLDGLNQTEASHEMATAFLGLMDSYITVKIMHGQYDEVSLESIVIGYEPVSWHAIELVVSSQAIKDARLRKDALGRAKNQLEDIKKRFPELA